MIPKAEAEKGKVPVYPARREYTNVNIYSSAGRTGYFERFSHYADNLQYLVIMQKQNARLKFIIFTTGFNSGHRIDNQQRPWQTLYVFTINQEILCLEGILWTTYILWCVRFTGKILSPISE